MDDCNKVHTLMEEKDDKKSVLTTENNFKQDCLYAVKNRRIGEREQRIETTTKGFCGGCER